MSRSVSPRTANVLRLSRPIVAAHRLPIIEGMTDSLTAADPPRGRRWAERAAASLLDMLVGHAPGLADGAGQQDPGSVRHVLMRKGIERHHLARFGDALAAVMVDAAGAKLPRHVGGAWGDAFWAIIRRSNVLDGDGIGRQAIHAGPGKRTMPASAGA
jgi:hypothetical protein